MTHYYRQDLCRGPQAFGKGYMALGKGFAEVCLRQRALGKFSVGKGPRAMCRTAGKDFAEG